MSETNHFVENKSSRRRFFQTAAAIGASAAAASYLTSSASADPPNPFPNLRGRNVNEKIFNFALTLEYLESDLYRQALNVASGQNVDAPLADSPDRYRLKISPGGLS